jgi:hypothetical protein
MRLWLEEFYPLRSFLLEWSTGWVLSIGSGSNFFGEQGHVDVLENLAGRDAVTAIGRFDEVVALAAGVLAAERVGEGEAGSELPGVDQKTGAIGDPRSWRFHSDDHFVVGVVGLPEIVRNVYGLTADCHRLGFC